MASPRRARSLKTCRARSARNTRTSIRTGARIRSTHVWKPHRPVFLVREPGGGSYEEHILLDHSGWKVLSRARFQWRRQTRPCGARRPGARDADRVSERGRRTVRQPNRLAKTSRLWPLLVRAGRLRRGWPARYIVVDGDDGEYRSPTRITTACDLLNEGGSSSVKPTLPEQSLQGACAGFRQRRRPRYRGDVVFPGLVKSPRESLVYLENKGT